jgi:preprotein translocase subunit SecE
MARTNPLEFLQQVREEANKITWPSRRETVTSTIMVLIMVVAASVFFFAVDAVLERAVKLIFGF